MKKKLMLLALGAVALCSSAFSQLAVNQNINGNIVTGTIQAPVSANQTLATGTLITFVSTSGTTNGQTLTFRVVLTPSTNPPGMVSDIANAINNTFNVNNVSGSGPGGTAVNRFGSNGGEYSVSFVQVPFDLGWSAFLCVGALGAVAAARARRKNLAQLV